MGSRFAAAIATLLAMLLTTSVVLGHAELIASSPEDGSTITEQPLEITATFDEDLVPEQSDMSLRNAVGEDIARGRVDPAEPRVLRLAPPPNLPDGEYEVRWVAASADGHIERGSFTLRLVPPTLPTALPSASPSPSRTQSPSSAPSPSPSPSASPSPSPSPAPSPSPGPDSADASSAVVPIVAALLVLAALGLWLTRRRSR